MAGADEDRLAIDRFALTAIGFAGAPQAKPDRRDRPPRSGNHAHNDRRPAPPGQPPTRGGESRRADDRDTNGAVHPAPPHLCTNHQGRRRCGPGTHGHGTDAAGHPGHPGAIAVGPRPSAPVAVPPIRAYHPGRRIGDRGATRPTRWRRRAAIMTAGSTVRLDGDTGRRLVERGHAP